jgi:hypothetical protein
VLAHTDLIDVPADWAPLIETEEEIPYHTRYYRKRGRPSMKDKAQGQQYLTPPEEKALVAFILRTSAVGTPIRVKYIPALAFCIASRRATNRPSEPPNKNWPQAFRCRHSQLKSRNNRPMPWAQQALDQNYIGLLKAANNEAKTRRKTRSDILKKPGKNGEGPVMRQEDLEVIRADRAERAKQEAAKKAVGKAKRGRPKATTQADGGEEGKKRGRKRKSVAAEEGVPNEQEVDESGPSAKAARASEALIDLMLETWRAPVSQMW